jgi:hypothetical protein
MQARRVPLRSPDPRFTPTTYLERFPFGGTEVRDCLA